jgi:hypothetical protein
MTKLMTEQAKYRLLSAIAQITPSKFEGLRKDIGQKGENTVLAYLISYDKINTKLEQQAAELVLARKQIVELLYKLNKEAL